MPRDLPGMYWDEARGRYFPTSSRPANASPARTIPQSTSRQPSTSAHQGPPSTSSKRDIVCRRPSKRRRVDATTSTDPIARCRSSLRFNDLSRHVHDLMTCSISSLSEGSVVSHGDLPFSSFDVAAGTDGCYVASTGDTAGWLQTHTLGSQNHYGGYNRELYLGSMVSAVCRSPTHRLAVSFGPSCKIAVENMAQDAELWTIMSMPANCYDIRTAHLSGNSLALGAARKGILFPNIEADWHYEILPTESDVFSITQHGPLTYLGTRNGCITRFDNRLDGSQKGQALFGSRYTSNSKTITHLSVLHDCQMLLSTISGDIEVHDLRFAREDIPFMRLRGHVNSYTGDIGLAVSPCTSYVFAAGQDRRIRAWSLRTGEPLQPPPAQPRTYDDDFSELFHQHFTEPVAALQVIENEVDGPSLWALTGRNLYRYWLGRRL